MACFKFVSALYSIPSKAIFFSLNTVLLLCAVVGNSIVMYLVLSKRRLHLPTFFLIFTLSLSDFTTALIGQTTYCIEVAFMNGTTSCTKDRVIAVVNASSCGTSLLLLCMIARDRYLHVSKGMRYSEHTSAKQVILICISCWLIGISIACLFIFEDRYMKTASMICFAMLGVVCFAFICVISRKVHRLVQSHFLAMEKVLEDQPDQSNNKLPDDIQMTQKFRSDRVRIEKTVNRSIFAVVIIYSLSWFPIIVLMMVYTVYNFCDQEVPERLQFAFIWSSTTSYCNGAINPFIYAYRCDAIGREIKRFVFRLKPRHAFRIHPLRTVELSNNDDTLEMGRNQLRNRVTELTLN